MPNSIFNKIIKTIGYPIRRKGCTPYYTVCVLTGLNITNKETYPEYVIKYGIKRRGFWNMFYRFLYNLK